MGTPQELTNQDGDVIWLSYDRAWGGSFDTIYKQQFIDNFAITESELQPIKFQGQSLDTETGLHYNRFRYYDSDVGMFISRDPIELLGGFNVFAYAPNPVMWIDPWGLECVYRAIRNSEEEMIEAGLGIGVCQHSCHPYLNQATETSLALTRLDRRTGLRAVG